MGGRKNCDCNVSNAICWEKRGNEWEGWELKNRNLKLELGGPGGGGWHGTEVAPHPAGPGSSLSVPKIFSEKLEFLDVVEIYRLQCTA